MSKLILKSEDYAKIEERVKLSGTEDYVVLAHKRHNKVSFSIHVFERLPMPKEVVAYEETASRMKFKGTRAMMEGSQVQAARNLYDVIIARAYDVPVGRFVKEQLDRDNAIREVPVLHKREAIREFIGNVQSASALAEDEGEDTEVAGKEDD